eukprot:9735521-Lingulodinium_polyedra.AAC.1
MGFQRPRNLPERPRLIGEVAPDRRRVERPTKVSLSLGAGERADDGIQALDGWHGDVVAESKRGETLFFIGNRKDPPKPYIR